MAFQKVLLSSGSSLAWIKFSHMSNPGKVRLKSNRVTWAKKLRFGGNRKIIMLKMKKLNQIIKKQSKEVLLEMKMQKCHIIFLHNFLNLLGRLSGNLGGCEWMNIRNQTM